MPLTNGSSYFFPALGAADRSLHPLMAWWAVLHTLSMLARYQPAEWGTHINVDASPNAVQLEHILKEAISTLPNLVAEAIDQVANPRSYLASVAEFGPGTISPSAW
jgi:YaaC-like Protein